MKNSATETSMTEQVFLHHLGAFAEGIDELMKDYDERSVIITPTGTYSGVNEIYSFFESFLATATSEFWAAFQITTQVVEGDVAYLTWDSSPFVTMATDTLVIRNSRIAIQTFTLLQ